LPAGCRRRSGGRRDFGLSPALLMRVAPLASVAGVASLSEPVVTPGDFGLSWRDVVMRAGGGFLVWKAIWKIHRELLPVAAAETPSAPRGSASLGSAIAGILAVYAVLAVGPVPVAVGPAAHVEVMIAAVTVAIPVMALPAGPLARLIERKPSTRDAGAGVSAADRMRAGGRRPACPF